MRRRRGIGQQSPQRFRGDDAETAFVCRMPTTLALSSLKMSRVVFFNIDQVARLLNNGFRETLRNLSRQAHGTGATNIHSLSSAAPGTRSAVRLF